MASRHQNAARAASHASQPVDLYRGEKLALTGLLVPALFATAVLFDLRHTERSLATAEGQQIKSTAARPKSFGQLQLIQDRQQVATLAKPTRFLPRLWSADGMVKSGQAFPGKKLAYAPRQSRALSERHLLPALQLKNALGFTSLARPSKISPLVFITPPIPTRRASLSMFDLIILVPAYPVSLSLPERVLPPLPQIKTAYDYPPHLNLPPITPLAYRIPQTPTRNLASPVPELAISILAYPVSLALPERVLPPLPFATTKLTYPPRLNLNRRIKTGVAIASNQPAMTCTYDGRTHAAVSSGIDVNQTRLSTIHATTANLTPAAFALKLVAAVKEQMADWTYYNARYIPLSYPMGDVSRGFGVCSDVLVRAYRRLGFDLQELVYRARIGKGDVSIDHRRTEVLRTFFARHGETLPITDFPEDYEPGDIVSYYRPFGRSSKSHIAIVADEIAPTGRPYLLHNRAWGVQKEDALFVDKITGHYRFNKVMPFKQVPIVAVAATTSTALVAGMSVLPERAPPSFAKNSRRQARNAKRSTTAGPARRQQSAANSVPVATNLPTSNDRGPPMPRGRRGRLKLCSPYQPRAIKLRIAHLCSKSAREGMGLGDRLAKR